MRAAQAVEIIGNAIWRPGLEVRARVYDPFSRYNYSYGSDYDSRTIAVEIIIDTYDSSEVSDAGRYTKKIRVAPMGTISVSDMTEDELLYHVLTMVREAQEHEDREFLRVRRGGRWTAPFHPHNDSGNRLWDQRGKGARRSEYAG